MDNKKWWLALVAAAVLIGMIVQQGLADDSLGLGIAKSSTNFVITVTDTNWTANAVYEVYSTPRLADPVWPWALTVIGSAGQTNFTVPASPNGLEFFWVWKGNDADGDGIPNYQDANPLSTNYGALTITIDSPTSNQVFE